MNLSYSLIRTYQSCPLQYRYSYVERRPRAPRKNLQLPKKIHAALRRYYLYSEYGVPEFQRIAEAYSEAWGARANPEIINEPAYQDGLQVLRGYYEAQKGTIQRPVMLEQRFELELGAHRFAGKIDRVDLTDEGELEILDYKLDREIPPQDALEQDLQLGLYLAAVKEMQNRTPMAASRYYLRHNVKVSVSKTSDEIERVARSAADLGDRIERDTSFEARPGRVCGSCSYRKDCPAVSSKPKATEAGWAPGHLPLADVGARYVTPEIPGL
ncbi:MAG TPA: PD-(D/E)XK nuclease family protein [Armatimonadota bacterium]|nr:PD-(D/E)XK nuclease family protein [Armatimonadota bacterium]